MPQQFKNPANPAVHERTTGRRRSGTTRTARWTCSSAGVGTGGTITGAGRLPEGQERLHQDDRRRTPRFPKSSVGCAPGRASSSGHRRGLRPRSPRNRHHRRNCGHLRGRVPRVESQGLPGRGHPPGTRSGAIVAAAVQVAKRAENDGKRVVAVIPSSSERYLSTSMYANIDAQSDEVPVGGLIRADVRSSGPPEVRTRPRQCLSRTAGMLVGSAWSFPGVPRRPLSMGNRESNACFVKNRIPARSSPKWSP